jgi:hypothetical protein
MAAVCLLDLFESWSCPMVSESARATTAAETRFRINAPNSKPRAVKVIALDKPSERLVKELATQPWNNASFFTASAFSGAPRDSERFSMQGWLSDLAGRTKDLVDEVKSADLVVMVATAGEDDAAASIIGEACGMRRVMTTSLIVGSSAKSDAELAKTLAQLRPYSQMLVMASVEDYIGDMLTALRA